jgi:hypothetical protein
MKATINGVTVEGTPAEIAELMGIERPNYFGIPIGPPSPLESPTPIGPCMHDFDTNGTASSCRKCGALYQPFQPTLTVQMLERLASENRGPVIVRNESDSLSLVPNVNITPLGRVCTGGMRFC